MFGAHVDREILDAAKETSDEICGVIIDGKPVFMPNLSEDPANEFNLGPLPEGCEAVFHSHPGGPFCPSKADMQQQVATDIPWGIACFSPMQSEVFWFGEGTPDVPLIGRGFRHGVTDCYGIVKDFYWQVHNIRLMEGPRDWEWWSNDETLYEDNFVEAGFTAVSADEILPGDVFLATIRSKTANHAGIYLGDGLILHHTCGRSSYDPSKLSTVEPAARWMNFLTKVLRYEKSDFDRTSGQTIWPRNRA